MHTMVTQLKPKLTPLPGNVRVTPGHLLDKIQTLSQQTTTTNSEIKKKKKVEQGLGRLFGVKTFTLQESGSKPR